MAINRTIYIKGSVGQRGQNQALDVTAVQNRLNEQMGVSRTRLTVDGKIGPNTRGMIYDFQTSVLKFSRPDSRVDPKGKTLAAMSDPKSATIWRSAPPVRGGTGKRMGVNLHFRFMSGRSLDLSEANQIKFRRVDSSFTVAANGSKFDMAHEVGHVLGLGHESTNGNLMHPTQAAYPKTPELTTAQLAKIQASSLCR